MDEASELTRRVDVLCQALQEKAEENMELQRKVLQLQDERRKGDKERAFLERDKESLRDALAAKAAVIEDLQKRLTELSVAAKGSLARGLPRPEKRPAALGKSEALLRVSELELENSALLERLGRAEKDLAAARMQNEALEVSAAKAREHLVMLESRSQDDLEHEAERRAQAEFTVKRLQRRVQDLEFQIKTLQEDSTDESESESDSMSGSDDENACDSSVDMEDDKSDDDDDEIGDDNGGVEIDDEDDENSEPSDD